MKKFKPLTPAEILKCFRDKKLFYPVGFPDENYIIGAFDIDRNGNAEITLVSLFLVYPIHYHVNPLVLLRNWRFADGSPCGVKMRERNRNMRKSRFEKEAAEYIKTHNDYRVFALDDADIMQIFKDGAEFGFQKGIKAKINTTTISDCPIKSQIKETACCDGEQDKPNVFQQFLEKELPEDIQRRVERAAEYGESNAEYFFRAGFFLAHELEEAKKNNQEGK